jgi:hypothetical protein
MLVDYAKILAMSLKINDLVAVSSLSKSVLYGRVVDVSVKMVAVSVGGNVVHAEPRHVKKIWDAKLSKRLKDAGI